ncbi:MAG: hypothetical protein D6814_11360 [Calditrichaeota bacterium]|nr:MAG: hypothetical protein D6814_11360 [Calditrichota bacterium]
METLLRGLLSGFIVGIVCVVYVLVRSSHVESQLQEGYSDIAQKDIVSNSWMMMALMGSASLVWGFIGAGIFRLMESQFLFVFFSILLALAVSITIYIRDVSYKFDKIVLTLIITLGLGLLIPYLI